MSHLSIAALAAAAVLLAAGPVSAGDLGDGGYGSGAYGHKPYYSGQGDHEGRTYGRRHDNGYTGDDHAGVYNDDDDDVDDDGDDDADDQGGDDGDYREQRYERHSYRYEGSVKDGYAPVPPAAVYSDRRGGACVPGWRVKQRLTGEGWTNFKLNNYGRGVAIIRATRAHTGRPFLLKVDGCTGETLSSKPDGFHDRRYSSRY